VVAKTDPAADPPHPGISLLLVEADTPGFVRGRKREKLGLPAQDTSDIFSRDCRVPAGNLLGREGAGLQDADGEAPAGAHLDRRGDDVVVMEASMAKW
jgi:alkylation response protein AidB-like acyl-CoA dehydrogenase